MSQFTIVGAGPVGTLMALLLARHGHHVQLFEKRPDPRCSAPEHGRSINLALAARGIAALQRADMLQRLAPQMITMPGRMLHDEQQRLQFVPYGQNEHEVIHAVSREHLNRVLVAAAAEHPAIELHFNQHCIDLDPLSGQLQLRDELRGTERTLECESVLAADGAGSAVRRALQRRGLTRVTEAPLAHDYKELLIAPTRALETHALHIWPRGGFMLIALPNTDGSFTATLFLARHGAVSFAALSDVRAVQRFFELEFPDAAAAMPDLVAQFARNPQSSLSTLYCEGWSADGRVLLMGDAAHAIVPFHGQGLNCGFEDCVLLERLLSGSCDMRTAFETFERERAPNTSAIATMALENYEEMRDSVRSLQFVQRKTLAAQLELRYPGRFIPRYSMVTFHPEIPYAQAQLRGAQQQQVLDQLIAQFGGGPLSPAELNVALGLIEKAGL